MAFRISTLVMALLFMVGAVEAHCLDVPAGTPLRLIVGVDKSRSILPEQMQGWKRTLEATTACLRPGDAISIFELHSNTAQAAIVFQRELPVEPPKPTIPQLVDVRNQVLAAKKNLKSVLDSVFSTPTDAQWTDVFGIFERVRVDSKRQTLLVLLSDAVHSTRELDLGRTVLKDSQFKETIDRLTKTYVWKPGLLKGTRVYVILPSLNGKNRGHVVNDRAILNRFYKTLVNALDGELASFSVDAATRP